MVHRSIWDFEMYVFALFPTFDPFTGKPTPDGEVMLLHERCDVTGDVFNEDDDPESLPYSHLFFSYCADPCFGVPEEEFRFARDFDIDMHEFLSDPYAFSELASNAVAVHAVLASNAVAVHAVQNQLSIADACRQLRVETARRLIDSGAIRPSQLSGYCGTEEVPPYPTPDQGDQ
jgi:hypothetical protein